MDILTDEYDYLQDIDKLYHSWKEDNEGHDLFPDYLESKGYDTQDY